MHALHLNTRTSLCTPLPCTRLASTLSLLLYLLYYTLACVPLFHAHTHALTLSRALSLSLSLSHTHTHTHTHIWHMRTSLCARSHVAHMPYASWHMPHAMLRSKVLAQCVRYEEEDTCVSYEEEDTCHVALKSLGAVCKV